MKNILSEEHQRQWDTFDVLHAQALDELIQGEIGIRKEYGMVDAHPPFEARNKIQRNRQAWTDEWGARGSQSKMITEWQQEETETQENEQMLEDMFQQKQADDQLKDEIGHALEEKEAVTRYYELRDEPVPSGTQQRFAKRFLELKDRYDGTEPQPRRTLDSHDLQNEAESWQDLVKQHQIIRMHYQRAKYIPDASVEQMANETKGYKQEVEANRPAEKVLAEAQTEDEPSDAPEETSYEVAGGKEMTYEELLAWEDAQIAGFEARELMRQEKKNGTMETMKQAKQGLTVNDAIDKAVAGSDYLPGQKMNDFKAQLKAVREQNQKNLHKPRQS